VPSATAVFKAVADFASLNSEVDKTAAKLTALKSLASDPASSKAFESNVSKMATAQSKLRGETDKLTTSLQRGEEAATKSADKHTIALNKEQQAASSKLDMVQKLSASLANLVNSEKDASSSSDGHSTALGKEKNAAKDATTAHKAHSAALKDVARDTDDAARSSDKLGDSNRRTGSSAQQSKGYFASLSSELKNYSSSSKDADSSSSKFLRTLLLMVAPALPAFIGGLIGSIVALGGALIGILGAAAPAAGAIAALGPAALAAAGAVGTALLAFKGIGTALKALQSAQSQSAQSAASDAQAAASATRGLANAQDALANAERSRAQAEVQGEKDVAAADKALAQAHKDVQTALASLNAEREKAVRDLIDMQNAEIDARLSVESAEIALIDAQQNQAAVNASATSTALDKRKADLQVAEAEQRLAEARISSSRATEDNTKAQADGVNGAANVVNASNQVASAKDAETQAVENAADARVTAADRMLSADQSVTQAQRSLEAALEQVSSAANKQNAAQTALATAMSHLAPAGQQFVYFLQSLIPLVDKITGAAEGAFLPGLETAIKAVIPLVDSVAIPSIKAFGAVLSSLANDGAAELNSFQKDFLSFGTGEGPKLVDNFGHILLNLLSVIENLSMAAVPLLDWLTKLTLAWSEHIKATTQAARDTGQLTDFFVKVKDILSLLGNILKNVGGILYQVFAAAAPLGERLLTSFEELTKKTNDYLHTAEGFGKLKKYFDDMEPSIRIILQLLGMLATSIIGTGASKTTYELLVAVRDNLVPAFQRLAAAMKDVSLSIGQQLIEIISKLADVLTNLVNAGGGGGLSAFVTILNIFASVLQAITSVPYIAELGVWLLAIAGGLKAIKLIGSITGLSSVAGGINALAGRSASYLAGEAAPVKASPTSFVGGVKSAVAGETATPRTITARAGAAVGGAAMSVFKPGTPAASPVQTAVPAGAAPFYPPGTPRSAPAAPSRLSAVAGSVGRGAVAVGRVAGGIAGSIGGGLAGAAIGQAVGGDTGAAVGGIAGSIAGSFAPEVISAGLAKIKPLAEAAKSALSGVASTLSGAVASAAGSAASGLGKAVGSALQVAGAVASAAGSYIKLGVETLAANAKQLLFAAGSAIVKGATAAWAAVQWLLNAAMDANPIGLVVLAIAALVAAFIYAWTHSETFRNIVIGALDAVGAFFTAVWTNVIKPIVDLFLEGLQQLGDAGTWLWVNAIKPALDFMGAAFGFLWNTLVKPVIDSLVRAFQDTGNAALWLWNNAIKPALDFIGGAFTGIYNNILLPIFNGFMGVVHLLGDTFTNVIGAIEGAWNRLGDIAKGPVNFVIDVVYNRGIVPLWNGLAGVFGLGKLAPAALLAEGGVLPGYAPGRDSVPVVLSPGEGVLVPEAVRGLGPDFVYKANEFYSGGRAKPAGGNRFAGGGVVGDVTGAIASMVSDPVGSVRTLFGGVSDDAGRVPGSGGFTDVMKAIPSKVIDAVIEKAKDYAARAAAAAAALANAGASGLLQGGGAGVEQWRATGLAALTAENQALENIGALLMQMSTESGGNPTVVNQWDSNWQAGHPSVGLMQVIAGTYAAYKDARFDKGPYSYGVSVDPMANITSAIKYTVAAYGSLAAGWKGHGYADGGVVTASGPGGGDSVPAMLTPGEFVLSRGVSEALGLDLLTRLNASGGVHAADLFSPVGRASVQRFALGGAVRAGLDAALSAGSSSTVVHGASSSDSSRDVVINTNIYNPVAETASDSAAARMRSLSLMGMFS
jgi:hypothetical protein